MTFKPLFLTMLACLFIASAAHLTYLSAGFQICQVLSWIFFCLGFAVFVVGYYLKVTGKLKK
jgi:hypothetical protein